MKNILFLALASIALCIVSCRTQTPLDPMTMKPSTRCLPDGSGSVGGSAK